MVWYVMVWYGTVGKALYHMSYSPDLSTFGGRGESLVDSWTDRAQEAGECEELRYLSYEICRLA